MRKHPLSSALFFAALSVCSSQLCFAQQKPLTRTFVVGSEERYQVTVIIHIETHGVSTEKIGEKTYVTPFTHEASGQVSWRATRKISALAPDGSAAITETLDRFQASCDKDSNAKDFYAELQKSVKETCADWQNLSQMNYDEEKFGLIRGLPIPATVHDDDGSTLLDYWLRRAFRPSVILPKGPLNFGYQAAHKISNPSGIASNPEGEELVEWLEGPTDPPAAILHVSQILSWMNDPRKSGFSNVGGTPAKRQLFFADSLNTISLLDGSLLKGSRSATRETKEVLDPVPGLPDAPTFSSKLTITVSILRLP